MQLPREFWKQLQSVKHFSCLALDRSRQWKKQGGGVVTVMQPANNILLFHDRGVWEGYPNISFSNTFRWTVAKNTLSVEHLRFGPDRPVFLVELTPQKNTHFISVKPHVCNNDTYSATIDWSPDDISLHWTVNGPKKNEEITYRYRSTSCDK